MSMFVLAGCRYVVERGQTLYGGMIYRPLYKVCPPNSADLVVRYYWVDSRTDMGEGSNLIPLVQVCPLFWVYIKQGYILCTRSKTP